MGKILNHRLLLFCCNLLFSVCGGFLVFSGLCIFSDTKRLLLSRILVSTSEQLNSLPQPLFYYVSLGLAAVGIIAVFASILGLWSSCFNTYCFLSLYFITVIILLFAELVTCLSVILWPSCLGINLDVPQIVRELQKNYGVPGKEQFTIAMDIAQTAFGCCGMRSESDYDASKWRKEGYGAQQQWLVPLTCCTLSNYNDSFSYLDPKPNNESQCQTLDKFEFSKYRHTKPCIEYLDVWYREQFMIFLGASLLIVIVEFFVLLSIVLNCAKLSSQSKMNEDARQAKPKSVQSLVESIYNPNIANIRMSSLNNAFRRRNDIPTNFNEIYVQPRDLLKSRHRATLNPTRNQYISPRSYIV